MNTLFDGLDALLTDLPRLEVLVNNPQLEKIAKLGDAFTDGRIDAVTKFLPLLENVPKAETLDRLAISLEKLPPAEEMEQMITLLGNIPNPSQLGEMVDLLKTLTGFLGAMKAADAP